MLTIRKWPLLGALALTACDGASDGSEFNPLSHMPVEAAPTDDGSVSNFADGGDAASPPDCDANPGACLLPGICGDGKAGLGEACDDGNTADGDGCSSKCQIEAAYFACVFGSKCIDV